MSTEPVNIQANQLTFTPVVAFPATSVIYAYGYINQIIARSNSGTAMTDTLPDPSDTSTSTSLLPNGWNITIFNNDVSASITVTPTDSTINGDATLVVLPGQMVNIITDGSNYFYGTSPSVSYQPVASITGTPIALGGYASGTWLNGSNSAVNMAYTLPNANTMPLGWWMTVNNTDPSASITITPSTSTINGAANLSVTAGKTVVIVTDHVNYFSNLPA